MFRGLARLVAEAAAQAAAVPATADLRLHLQRDGAQRRCPARHSQRGRQRARAVGQGSPYLLVDEAVEEADQQTLSKKARVKSGVEGRIISPPFKARTLARPETTSAAATWS